MTKRMKNSMKIPTALTALIFMMVFSGCDSRPGVPTVNGQSFSGKSGPSANTTAAAGGMTTGNYGGLACPNKETHRGIRSWRRLSNIEIKNTVDAVFGSPTDVDYSSFINDISKAEVFDTSMSVGNYVSTNRLKGYFTFAESLAKGVTINKLFPCLAKGRSCISSSLATLGAATWRRPLTSDELNRLTAVYDQLMTDGYASEAAARLVIEALVLSQEFLYRSELGVQLADGTYELTDYELASALSYATIRTVPDAELKSLADKKMLRDSATLAKQATRLLNLPAAKSAWKDFAGQWLQADGVLDAAKTQTAFTDTVKTKLSDEMKNFFVDTMFSATKKTYDQLLLADYTVGDNSSAFIYGGTVAGGKIQFKETQRKGLLGQAGFLASAAVADTTNPIKRGVFILSRLMCSGFAPAPATTFPTVKSGLSTKELFQQHSQGSCASCHKFIDDFGFALENFDEIGKFRDNDAGAAIVIKSNVTIDGKELAIASPDELSNALAHSSQAMECYARQTFRYTLGRLEYAAVPIIGGTPAEDKTTESQLDKCQIQDVASAVEANGGDLKTAFVELVSNPGFRLRLAGPGN